MPQDASVTTARPDWERADMPIRTTISRRRPRALRAGRPRMGSILIVTAAVLLTACSPDGGGSDPATASQATSGATGSASAAVPVTVATQQVDGVGPVLTTAEGQVLYLFVPDDQRSVTCTDVCAIAWPPVMGTPTAADGSQVQDSLLGTIASPAGGRQATYNGWPLYTYVGDTAPGQATGQALDANGGLWYAVTSAGAAAGAP